MDKYTKKFGITLELKKFVETQMDNEVRCGQTTCITSMLRKTLQHIRRVAAPLQPRHGRPTPVDREPVQWLNLKLTAMANEPATPTAIPPGKDIADVDLIELASVQVSPFDVSHYFDSDYRASNSVSGPGFDTPIQGLFV